MTLTPWFRAVLFQPGDSSVAIRKKETPIREYGFTYAVEHDEY